MSYVSPTSVIFINGGTDEVPSGTFQIQLNIKQISGIGTDFSMDVTKVGSVEIDFNYIQEIGDINDFTINTPTIEFEVLNTLRDSSNQTQSLIEIIKSLNAYDLIIIKQTYTPKGGSATSEYYFSTREQCEYSHKDRKVKISGKHPLKYGQPAYGQTWNISTPQIEVFEDNGGGGAGFVGYALFAHDFLEKYMATISDSNTFVNRSVLYENATTDGTLNAAVMKDSFVESGGVRSVDETDALADFSYATQRAKELALSEGAIIGNVLGYAFYVPRFDDTLSDRVALTSDDFLELSMDFSFKDVRQYSLSIRYGDTIFKSYNIYDGVETINTLGRNDITIVYPSMSNITLGAYDIGPPESLSFGTNVTVPALSTAFKDDIDSSFKKIFRVSDGTVDAGVAISGKIIGIDTLKPYEHFSVSSTDPLVNGKKFRPSYLKYDIVNDTIEFEAYEF